MLGPRFFVQELCLRSDHEPLTRINEDVVALNEYLSAGLEADGANQAVARSFAMDGGSRANASPGLNGVVPLMVLRGRATRRLGASVALLVLLALAACTPAPQLPLMSPIDVAGYFGYADKELGERRYQVTYSTPLRPTGFGEEARDADAERASALADDLAMWRAAELSLSKGSPSFAVLDRRRDIEVETREQTYYPPSYAFPNAFYDPRLCTPYYRARFPAYCYDMPTDFRGRWLRAKIALTIELLPGPREGAFAASDVVQRMRSRYPMAYAPPSEPSNY